MNGNIKMKRTVIFRDANKNRCEIEIELRNDGSERRSAETLEKIQYKYDVSVCGNCANCCGQCYDFIKPRTDGQKRLLDFWHKYHLNSTLSGTTRQIGYLESEQYEKDYARFVEAFSEYGDVSLEYDIALLNLKMGKLYNLNDVQLFEAIGVSDEKMNGNQFKYIIKGDCTWRRGNSADDYCVKLFFLAMHGLRVDRGYEYGTGFLCLPLPDNIEEIINDICSQIEREEAELTESLNPVFFMDDRFEATCDRVEEVMELRNCDEVEAKRFIALRMHIGCSFGDLNDTFGECSRSGCAYSANGGEYYIGTEDELEKVASDYVHESDDYEYLWRESVHSGNTTLGLEEWLDAVVDDGFAVILNHYDGTSESYRVDGEWIEVCRRY